MGNDNEKVVWTSDDGDLRRPSQGRYGRGGDFGARFSGRGRDESRGPKVVVEVSAATKKFLWEIIGYFADREHILKDDAGYKSAKGTVERLCGRPESGDTFSPPFGFRDKDTAAKDIFFLLGSLADRSGMFEEGRPLRFKYPSYNNIIKRNLPFGKDVDPIIQDIEYAALAQGITYEMMAQQGRSHQFKDDGFGFGLY